MEKFHALVNTVCLFESSMIVKQDQNQADRAVAAERDECCVFLKSNLHFHRQVPMALGSGCTSIDHKWRALSQKVVVEAKSSPAVFARVSAACVDMGTEFAVPDAGGLTVRDVLPDWMCGSTHLQEDAGNLQGDGDDGSLGFIMPYCLLAAGLCHILHNLVHDVDEVLSWWSSWIPAAKALAHLLHYDHLRKRMVQTMLRGTAYYDALVHLFDNGCPLHTTWRWGNIIGILVVFSKVI